MEISNLQGGNEDNFIDDTNQVQAEGVELDDTNQIQAEGAEANDMWDCIDDFNNYVTLDDFENNIEDFDFSKIIDALEAESPLSTSIQAKQPILSSDQVDSKAEFKDSNDSNSASTSFWPSQHKEVKPRNTKEILNSKLKLKLRQEGKVIPVKDDERKAKLVIDEPCLTEDDLRKDELRRNRNKEAARRSRERKKSEEVSVKQRNCDLTKEVKSLSGMIFEKTRKLMFLCKGLGEIYRLNKGKYEDYANSSGGFRDYSRDGVYGLPEVIATIVAIALYLV
ncbi:hypothetical protein PoB_001555500 [Plakobranchus ocellatus]|uniref:BZIP domain-containing protein n=1 Tax=Plakobranchus ocellatus TaxID=259542 RepID=A0AAV3Z362_9GAST|nr:hypothetical protein PoB_001555500 [Plakobranchus ocellatus]